MNEAPPHRRGRRRAGPLPRRRAPVGPRPRQGLARRARRPGARARAASCSSPRSTRRPPGEGKTTTSVALAMGLRRLGQNAVAALREPSLGPGLRREGRRHRRRQGVARARRRHQPPLHRRHPRDHDRAQPARRRWSTTRVTSATLGDKGELDPRQITLGPRARHERSLPPQRASSGSAARRTACRARSASTSPPRARSWRSSRSPRSHAGPRGAARAHRRRPDATTASPSRAGDVGAARAMTALLRDALMPNLVQTAEGGPALVHGGPVRQHRARLQLASSRRGSRWRSATTRSPRPASASTSAARSSSTSSAARRASGRARVVLVATLRALKMHGGAPREDVRRARRGRARARASSTSRSTSRPRTRFGLPAVVAINVLPERHRRGARDCVEKAAAARGARARALARASRKGGEGALELARRGASRCVDATDAAPPAAEATSTSSTTPPEEKIREDRAHRLRRRRRRVHRAAPRRTSSRDRELGGARAPRLHGEDAALAHRRSDAAAAARAASPSPCARCASPPAPASSSPLTGDMMTMPGPARRSPPPRRVVRPRRRPHHAG